MTDDADLLPFYAAIACARLTEATRADILRRAGVGV